VLGIGTVIGPYKFVPGAELGHRLPVHWDDLTPRRIQEGNWRNTLRPLGLQKFESIREAPPVDDHSEQQGRSIAGVRAVLWKKLNRVDIQVLSGQTRQLVTGGGGQPDLRLNRRLISNQSVLEFVEGTEEAEVISTDPLNVIITQRLLPGPSYREISWTRTSSAS
jgi:hypothetical protein